MAQEEMITGNVALTVKGIPLEFEMAVPAKPVRPRRLLPIFQKMANSMVDAGVEVIEAQAMKISCKAHCGACCRQPVPISEMEIYHLAELVENMPEPRQSEIKERFNRAVEHFTNIGWYERFRSHQERAMAMDDKDSAIREGIDLTLEYFQQGIPCPFLEEESCSIYLDRPVVCREYMVTSPSNECADPTPMNIKRVDLLLKPSTVLNKIARTPNYQEYGVPILTRALELALTYPENPVEKTGQEWMRDFFEELSGKEVPENKESTAN